MKVTQLILQYQN